MGKYAKIVQSDSRGQIVIPKSVRKKLGIKEGAAFWVYTSEDGIYLKKVESPDEKKVRKEIKEYGK